MVSICCLRFIYICYERKNREEFKWNEFWILVHTLRSYKVSNDKEKKCFAIYFVNIFRAKLLFFRRKKQEIVILRAYYDDDWHHIYWEGFVRNLEILKMIEINYITFC